MILAPLCSCPRPIVDSHWMDVNDVWIAGCVTCGRSIDSAYVPPPTARRTLADAAQEWVRSEECRKRNERRKTQRAADPVRIMALWREGRRKQRERAYAEGLTSRRTVPKRPANSKAVTT